MTPRAIARRRLARQHVASPKLRTPEELVSSLVAVQAQDFLGSLWAIGLRLPAATERDVETAVAERTIVRTWAMRGTLHFVAAADVRWMLGLLAPRMLRRAAGRTRGLGVDEAGLRRSRELLVGAMRGGGLLTRPEIYALLSSGGVRTDGQKGMHILWMLAHEGVLCLATREGRQQTFGLLDEWVPGGRSLTRDEALEELARRYFTGHGPATVMDFSWWSGLGVSDARAGLEAAASGLARHEAGGETYWEPKDAPELEGVSRGFLLPAFDEFLVAYADRTAALDLDGRAKPPTPFQVLSPAAVVDGLMVGTWKRSVTREGVVVRLSPFSGMDAAERRTLLTAAGGYARFLGTAVEVL